MTWRATERLLARNYQNREERHAFLSAYHAGYHHHDERFKNTVTWRSWPNACGAGFNEGRGDRDA